MDQAGYATSIVAKYLETATVKVSNKFYKTTFPANIILPKEDVSTSDERVEKLTREYNIQKQSLRSIIDLSIVYKSGLEFWQYTS